MTTTSQSSNRPATSDDRDLRDLVDELVYARVLVAAAGESVREHDRPLRLALGDALDQLAESKEERRRIALEALELAWARLASELESGPGRGVPNHAASAA